MSSILMLSPVPVLPPTAGNRVRIATLAQVFEDLGHTVYFMHVLREAGDQAGMRARWGDRYVPVPYRAPGLRNARWRRLGQRLGLNAGFRYPLDAWYDPATDAALDRLLHSVAIDVAVVEYVFMSRALERVPASTTRVLDTHDVFTDRHLRYIASGQAPRWFSCSREDEARGLDRADLVLAIQAGEADYFESITDRPVLTVGHIVTTERLPELDPARVLIVGSDNPINVESTRWFLDQVAPRIRNICPDAQITLAGTLCASFQGEPLTALLGAFDRADTVYATSAVVVNPMRLGTGLKIKTIEALGFARPTITTSSGAAGLESGANEAFLVADDPVAMAEAVCTLLNDEAARRDLGTRALDFARRYNVDCLAGLQAVLRPQDCGRA